MKENKNKEFRSIYIVDFFYMRFESRNYIKVDVFFCFFFYIKLTYRIVGVFNLTQLSWIIYVIFGEKIIFILFLFYVKINWSKKRKKKNLHIFLFHIHENVNLIINTLQI
jgi:hypothetical protein